MPDIAGEVLSPRDLAQIRKTDIKTLPVVSGRPRLGPCVGGTRHFVAIGLNYSDHAKETNSPIPAEPIIFEKAPSCISGPNDAVIIPRDSLKLDWEVELCVVIGCPARYLSKVDCHERLVSERHFQRSTVRFWHFCDMTRHKNEGRFQTRS